MAAETEAAWDGHHLSWAAARHTVTPRRGENPAPSFNPDCFLNPAHFSSEAPAADRLAAASAASIKDLQASCCSTNLSWCRVRPSCNTWEFQQPGVKKKQEP